MKIYLLYVSGLLCAFSQAFANGPPINSETAFTTGLNGAAFRSFVSTGKKSGSGGEIYSVTTKFILPYEVLDNQLVMGAGIPFHEKTLTLPDGSRQRSGYGAGDLFLFGKYNLYQKDQHQQTLRVAGKAGLSLPTGKNDLYDSRGKLPSALQRGTGSVNPSASVIATRLWKRFGLNGDLGFVYRPEADSVNLGESFRFDLSGVYRLLPDVYELFPSHQINLMLEMNGDYTGKSKSRGIKDMDSGGAVIFASPGIQYIYSDWIVEASVQLPVVKALHGTQMEPDYAVTFGIRWLMF